MTTRPPLRPARKLFSVVPVLLSLLPASLCSQSYEGTPLYRAVAAPDGDAVMIRHASANGVTADISVASTDGGWNQGIRTDGWAQHEIVHIYLQPSDSTAVFAYDLLLEPIPGTRQIRGTFSPQSPEVFAEEKRDAKLVPLPGELAPVVVEEGGTLAITLFADADRKLRITQYLHLRRSTAREQSALAFPAMPRSCPRIR